MIRLLKRIGAIGAASVALFCSGLTFAGLPAPSVNVWGVDGVTNADGAFEARYRMQRRFAMNDPVWPGKTDYVTRKVTVPKRGNPLAWVKKMPWEVAAIAAVGAAGWAIDELTNQVTRPSPVDPDGYVEGKFWNINANGFLGDFHTDEQACQAYGDYAGWTYTETYNGGSYVSSCSYEGHPNVVGTIQRNCYDYPSSVACTTPPEPDYEQLPVPDTEVWTVVDPVIDSASSADKTRLAVDPAGNPYIYPEVKDAYDDVATGVAGAPAADPSWVVNNPLEGQGYDPLGEPTGNPSPTPETTSDSPYDIPDDYARENTLHDLWTVTKEFFDTTEINQEPDIAADTPADSVFQPFLDEIGGPLPNLPGNVIAPDFGIQSSGSCQTITFNWGGASVVFPNSSQCSKLNTGKEMVGWIIYVFTWFGIINIIMGARRFA